MALESSFKIDGVDEHAEIERGEDLDIVIAGGGLAGLALALALQERNIEAHVFETQQSIRSYTATAIGIGSNGLTALEGIKPGLSYIIAQAGTYTTSLKFILVRDGKEDPPRITQVPQNQYITVRWQSVHEILASLVDKNRVVFSHKFVGYRPCKEKPDHECHTPFSHKKILRLQSGLMGGVDAYFKCGPKHSAESVDMIRVIRTKLLIGADGIWSAVRNQMVGDPPRYLNMVDWNALLYNPDLKNYNRINKGEIVGRAEENGPHSLIAHAGDYTLWILRKKDESGDLANIVQGGKSVGLGNPGCKARALQQLDGHQEWDMLRQAIEASNDEIISERKIMDRLPLDKWSDADGHVLLIGDAAHAQYVGPGQGARTAFEDAHQLSLLLEESSGSSFSHGSIQHAVKRFEEMRIPRLKKMQEYASYSTKFPKFQPERFQRLTIEDRRKMWEEYTKWTHAYPDKQEGDPDSYYFK